MSQNIPPNPDTLPFVPIFTVMVDYGGAPFLWLLDSPDQIGVGLKSCDGYTRDESLPMSEELWQKFAVWAIEFNQTAFYSEKFNSNNWDWPTFHARGFQLAKLLKNEVGEDYRVVYIKAYEDPNYSINSRTEILADGEIKPLAELGSPFPRTPRFCQHIISGGQTGVDRAALDFAIKHGYTHGGWALHERMAEDGAIPRKYQLLQLAHSGYDHRNHRNVEDSDATLIVNVGSLEGGIRETFVFAERLNKPHLVVQLENSNTIDLAASVLQWLRQHQVKKLNIAGPRETKRPGIYRKTLELLVQLHDAAQKG